MISRGGSIPLFCLKVDPDLLVALQDEAILTKKFEKRGEWQPKEKLKAAQSGTGTGSALPGLKVEYICIVIMITYLAKNRDIITFGGWGEGGCKRAEPQVSYKELNT